MDKRRALELLKNALTEIAHLRTLDLGNKVFDQWYYKVLDILEVTFSKNSSEYERFARAVRAYLFTYTKADRQKEYNRRLDEYETALKSIIKKYEMLEEEKPIAKTKTIKALKNRRKIREKQPTGKEIRKHLRGTPEELAPHIVRVANEFQFQGFNYYAQEESYESSQFSKQFTMYRITGCFTPGVIWSGAKPEELPCTIGTITLQSLPNNKTLLIAKHTLPSFDSEGSYFNNFLERLSLEFKNLGFEQKSGQKIWRWIKSHKILSILGTLLILLITLLGTNWTTVQDNIAKLLEFLR